MDIQEIKAEKKHLENAIHQQLLDFNSKTGLFVEDIHIHVVRDNPIGGGSSLHYERIFAEVRI